MTIQEIERAIERLTPAELAELKVWLETFDARQNVAEITLLSEASLAVDWNRPEEDEAWSYLQPGK